MTFEEHLHNFPRGDGSYDLHEAEKARAEEIAGDPDKVDELSRSAAKAERTSYEKGQRNLRLKQFVQAPLSPELDMEIMVPLGDNVVVPYGDMNVERIRLRKDLRTEFHIAEARAFDNEITHWVHTEKLLGPGQTIREAV